MARALESILRELDSVYNPQKDVYNKQINALPGQQQAELGGLEAAKKDSFEQIVTGANRRGVAFGGIPLEEQASYLGQSYLPAVANLKSRFQQNRFNLQSALAELGIQQRKDAYGIRDQELAREEAAAARRASAGGGSGFNPAFGDGQVLSASGGYGMGKKKNGGFAFVDAFGNPVSAATYAAATGTPFRQLLQAMANQGDKGAKEALGFVGDDFGYDTGKLINQGLYNALTWGANVKRPTGAPQSGKGLQVSGGGLAPAFNGMAPAPARTSFRGRTYGRR